MSENIWKTKAHISHPGLREIGACLFVPAWRAEGRRSRDGRRENKIVAEGGGENK